MFQKCPKQRWGVTKDMEMYNDTWEAAKAAALAGGYTKFVANSGVKILGDG